MLKKVLTHSVAFVAGGILLGGSTVALASSNVVQAIKGTSSVYANGKLIANPPKLVYGGTTYVQLYSIQHGLIDSGIPATWDGNNFKMTIPYEPPAPTNNVVKLTDMKTLTVDTNENSDREVSSFKDNLGGTYAYGGIQVYGGYDGSYYHSTYLLNGQFKKLTGTLVPSFDYATEPEDPNIGHLQIYGDGKLLYDSGAVASDITKPIQVNVNLTGVTKLELRLDSGDGQDGYGYLGFVNAVFSK